MRICRNNPCNNDHCPACGGSPGVNHVRHGFFSKEAELNFGSWEVATPSGGSVRITAICDTQQHQTGYGDIQYVGEIVNGTNRNRIPSQNLAMDEAMSPELAAYNRRMGVPKPEAKWLKPEAPRIIAPLLKLGDT